MPTMQHHSTWFGLKKSYARVFQLVISRAVLLTFINSDILAGLFKQKMLSSIQRTCTLFCILKASGYHLPFQQWLPPQSPKELSYQRRLHDRQRAAEQAYEKLWIQLRMMVNLLLSSTLEPWSQWWGALTSRMTTYCTSPSSLNVNPRSRWCYVFKPKSIRHCVGRVSVVSTCISSGPKMNLKSIRIPWYLPTKRATTAAILAL